MNLTHADFLELFDCENLSERCQSLINQYDFTYTKIKDTDRDKVILDILKKSDSGFNAPGISKWERGWGENLNQYLESRDKNDLIPKYYKKAPMRLKGEFISSDNDNFEVDFFDVLRTFTIDHYLSEVECIYEFGCGPLHNLLAFNELYPNKKYIGLDWAEASQKIASALNVPNISGINFDMFHPNKFDLAPNSAVITIGALEQLGTEFKPMLEYWLTQPASVFIHLEPIIEFYEDNLIDYLAKKFTLQRNYLNGYFQCLKKLDVDIQKAQRIRFGSLFHEGWSILVWNHHGENKPFWQLC